jgi:hypothetical protein
MSKSRELIIAMVLIWAPETLATYHLVTLIKQAMVSSESDGSKR